MLTYTKGNNQLVEIKQRYMLIQESDADTTQKEEDDNQPNEPEFNDRSATQHLVHGTKQLSNAIPAGITFGAIATAASIVVGGALGTLKIAILQVLITQAINNGDWDKVIQGYGEVGITAVELVAILAILGIPLISLGPLISSCKIVDGAYSILAGISSAIVPKGWGNKVSTAMNSLRTISMNIAAGIPLSVVYGLGHAVGGVASGATEVARGVVNGIADTVTGKPIEGIKSIGKGVYDGAKDVGSGLYHGAKSVGSGVYNGAKELGGGIYNGIKSVGSSIYNIGK